jgi:SAM-dependent methyltransferase
MNGRIPQPIAFDSVADLYDIYVCTEFDIPFWTEESNAVSGKVLELACGTGRVSIPLLRAGVDLTCVDYAPAMLARLREKLSHQGLSCPVYAQDMAELNLADRFDLIFIPFHSFSEITDPQRQRQALKRISAHLTDTGRFICTLQNPAVRTQSMDGEMHPIGGFPLPDGGVLKVDALMVFDPLTHIASGEQIYDRYSPEGMRRDRRVLQVNFFLFDKRAFEQLLPESGLAVEALYGDYDRRPSDDATSPYLIWKLKKIAEPQ